MSQSDAAMIRFHTYSLRLTLLCEWVFTEYNVLLSFPQIKDNSNLTDWTKLNMMNSLISPDYQFQTVNSNFTTCSIDQISIPNYK